MTAPSALTTADPKHADRPRWPTLLPANATLGVWAPSSPAPVLFPRRFARGLASLSERGYTVVVGESCRAAQGAGTLPPQALAEELHSLLEETAGVIAAVGGWTLTPVLPYLDFDRIGRAGKPLIGYSDLTSLVNLVPRRSGLVAFHGPMVVSEWGECAGPWELTAAEFDQVLGRDHSWIERPVGTAGQAGQAEQWSDENLFWDRDDDRRRQGNSGAQPPRTLRTGEATGPLWGGSLLVLGLLLGTDLWPDPAPGSIVFLEADGLPPDELWARLEQFRLAGVFDRAGGVIMGKISNPRTTPSGYTGYDDILRRTLPSSIPVAAGFDLGHADPMSTLPVGGWARLTCLDTATPSLSLLREPSQ
ncbi:LD-carboxypeptidase [Streptomyces sp. NBC_01637]|uniref:LD-carboxypeptidase n=1 Tax=unclassified Streptomyces TaxID=2593676 RepID=UPI00386DCAC8|nr:LD-carboxypeptidase [Streptomyces sp. NBC_01653]WTC84590.1 LD-carboxypeptidase [Streptomyces sp. NBC_01653]WTD86277.1 LD-carboxypeptidase [Streptomyces sp. NBC_01637]WTD94247.1 LD-carboxypeptidase [Streptomyces sp. NBC_01637]